MPRCFIAVTPPAEILDSVGAWQGMIRRTLSPTHSIRWTRRDQFHLTLSFLGDVNPDDLGELAAAVTESCGDIPSFELTLSDPGAFPSLKRPRVLWLGVDGDRSRLSRLQRGIEANCRRFGSHIEPDRFHPHLTLARIRAPNGRFGDELHATIAAAKSPTDHRWTINSVELITSRLAPSGSTYDTLHAARFGL